ncbi:hypothetical protein OEW28_06765 [Defluviimonas sp. WL0002]|uniref:Glycosyl transferase family 2 n=1 Tax=Albidovulum marisflavi TaxID=2984159 RepID=A0ABT2ZBB2_9RHOB|nr:hypothetical protein [Defluviimonas sp. WL0002]MCV2868327.1 hypothetical protein [Defluviimonas sp. WL0002]
MSTVFVTMVYNDEVFLDIWSRYYAQYTDRKNLHVITHGPQPNAAKIAPGCTFLECPRDPRNPRLDQDRFAFINDYCAGLTKTHDRVIYNDVDEIVVLDPGVGSDLVGYIEAIAPDIGVITPLGLEIIHRPDIENDYDFTRPLFSQRKFVRVNGWYTKPCITNVPVVWGPDGHGSSHPHIHVDENLFVFHLKWFDKTYHVNRHKERLAYRFKDDNGEEVIIGAGSWSWSALTYKIVTNSLLRMSFDKNGKGFDFSAQRERVRNSFVENDRGMHKIDWFVESDMRELPERFVGLI